MALIYGLPLLGGIIADRYLGMKKAITFGAILLVLGHISMAFEGPSAKNFDGSIVRDKNYLNYFFLSISLIAVGVGFLKANISNLVGTLYSKKMDEGTVVLLFLHGNKPRGVCCNSNMCIFG